MKVVINVSFGGFSLSRKAIARMAELQGRPCFFFTHERGNPDRYVLSESPREGRDMFFVAFDIPNPNDVLKSTKDWHTMTKKDKDTHNTLYRQHKLPRGGDLSRTDPLLIQVVEELGKEANGDCAELKIVNIPDGTDYEIDEYDGNEHIAEKHQTWR